MDSIRQATNKIEFAHHLSIGVRIILAVFGLFPLLAPYELLIKPFANGAVNIFVPFFLFISLGAISVSLFLLSAAIFGRSQYFQFDDLFNIVIYRYWDLISGNQEERYQFHQIELLAMEVSTWDSSPDTYNITLKIKDKKYALKFGNFASLQDAEKYLQILKKMTADK